jgi:hypothetical protein
MRRIFGGSFGLIILVAVALTVGIVGYYRSSELGISGIFAGLLTARRATAQQDPALHGRTLPPIDIAAPARTETATLAMG